jgi:hypothetical protein
LYFTSASVSCRNAEIEDSEQKEEPQKRGRDPRNWFTSTIFSTTSSYGLGAWGWYYLTTTSTSFSTSTSTTSRFTCEELSVMSAFLFLIYCI